MHKFKTKQTPPGGVNTFLQGTLDTEYRVTLFSLGILTLQAICNVQLSLLDSGWSIIQISALSDIL